MQRCGVRELDEDEDEDVQVWERPRELIYR